MAVKTITIDLEAYAMLSRHKRTGQSFSQVIKAHFGPQPTAGCLLERIRTIRMPADALDAMDALVRDRRRHPARVVSLEPVRRGR
jgi:predicted CopG family antitoxin